MEDRFLVPPLGVLVRVETSLTGPNSHADDKEVRLAMFVSQVCEDLNAGVVDCSLMVNGYQHYERFVSR